MKCWPLFIKTVKNLFFIGLPISIFIFLFSPFLFEVIFGEQWRVSGKIARWLGIVFLFSFVISSVSSVFTISGYIKRGAFWKHLYLITTLSIFIIFFLIDLELFDFIYLFVLHEILLYLFYFYLIVKSVKQMDEKIE